MRGRLCEAISRIRQRAEVREMCVNHQMSAVLRPAATCSGLRVRQAKNVRRGATSGLSHCVVTLKSLFNTCLNLRCHAACRLHFNGEKHGAYLFWTA
jgi:hypothetical protein